uniref:Insulin gene enhancer protein isl-1 n=1 Tax=Dugesia japonica TaxID=6161 RepID=F8WQS6_DUGJA|nr:insulin gene enhancer protein isl-1 [Dugesia japonica]
MTASLELEDCDDGVRSNSKRSIKSCSLCVGCGGAITDKFILRVQPDLEWHARCLRCVKCNRGLDEKNTCFVKDGKTYCKEDYQKLFLQVCAACNRGLHKSDYVLHVGSRIYHISCMKCVACNRILQTGDEFALRPNGVICLHDHQRDGHLFIENSGNLLTRPERLATNHQPPSPIKQPKQELETESLLKIEDETNSRKSGCCRNYLDVVSDERLLMDTINNNNTGNISRANSRLSYVKGILDDSSMNSDIDDISQDGSSVCGNQSINGGHGGTISAAGSLPSSGGGVTCTGNAKMSGTKRSKEQKTTRVRTVLNEKQLHTLRTCYAANPRPDALMKEQLVEMTGLSPRVIRVWFQNKRCKDKKRQIMVKQMDQHQQVGGIDCPLQGVPMVAGSPMRNEPPISCANPLEIQQIPGPWGSEEFGPNFSHGDISRSNDSAPAFQQLISAYHHLSRNGPCPPPPLMSLSHSPAHSQPLSNSNHPNLSFLTAMGLLSGARNGDLDDSPHDSFVGKLISYSVD